MSGHFDPSRTIGISFSLLANERCEDEGEDVNNLTITLNYVIHSIASVVRRWKPCIIIFVLAILIVTIAITIFLVVFLTKAGDSKTARK